MDKLNEKRTQPLGKVKPSLNKKLMDYCKLIGVQKIELLEELINKELEGKVLEDTFIIYKCFAQSTNKMNSMKYQYEHTT